MHMDRQPLAARNVEHGHVPRSGNVQVPDSGIFAFPCYKITPQVPVPLWEHAAKSNVFKTAGRVWTPDESPGRPGRPLHIWGLIYTTYIM